MKKTLCLIIAVVIALSSMTVVSYAAKMPDFKMKTSTAAKKGDIVKVDVEVGNNSKLMAVTFDLVYDNTYFEVVSATSGSDMSGEVNEKYTDKSVRFTAAKTEELQVGTVLFTAEFKVIKTGGSFSLEADEVIIKKIGGGETNITEDVQKELEGYLVTVECAHAEKKTTVLEKATCSKVGTKTEECSECGWKSEVIEIPMLDHELEEKVLKEATCEEAGAKAEKCKKCDYQSEETEIPATGHTEGEWEVVKKPTKTEKGLEQKSCTVCKKVIDEKEIPKLPQYKLGDVSEDGVITAVDARMILRYVAGLIELDDAQKLAADTNGDGEIGALDARMVLQYVVGKVKF